MASLENAYFWYVGKPLLNWFYSKVSATRLLILESFVKKNL